MRGGMNNLPWLIVYSALLFSRVCLHDFITSNFYPVRFPDLFPPGGGRNFIGK